MIDKKAIAILAAIPLIIIVCAYLLNEVGFSVLELIEMENWRAIADKFLSPYFITLLLILPLAYALAAIAIRKSPQKETIAIGAIMAAIGVIASLLIFQDFLYYWPIAIILILSFPFEMYTAKSEFPEKKGKKAAALRVIYASTKRGGTLMLIAMLIFGAIALMPQSRQLSNQFMYNVFDYAVGDNLSGLATPQVAGQFAGIMIEQQLQLVAMLRETPLFTKLREKQDVDIAAFVEAVDSIDEQIQSPAYKDQVTQQIMDSQKQKIEDLDDAELMQMVKEQFPIIKQMEPWFWLLVVLILISITQLAYSIVIAPLAGLYGLALDKLIIKKPFQTKK
ncbi:MAG: hypothetical protein JW772_05595 [Candidatus Diapherotrites archaeon]|nr:hypothetical protein [Candidatus Diapherotrites archaeon]